MRKLNRNVNLENMGNTLTIQHVGEYLGENKERLGTLATLWPEHVITAMTDTLANVFYGESKTRRGFNPVKKHIIEWEIEVNEIPKVYFSQAPTVVNGSNLEVFTVYTDRKYYDPNDVMGLENGQMLRVISPVRRINNNVWANRVQLVADSLGTTVNTAFLAPTRSSIYRSNYQPELAQRGYVKFMSDTQTHRNYMSKHYHSISWSSEYAQQEDVFLEHGKKDNQSVLLKLKKKELMVYENFMYTRESHLIFGQSNFDINGKCLHQDESGQDIPMGDGIQKQAERYASRTFYSVLDTDVLDNIVNAMIAKSGKSKGNTWAFITNQRFYGHFAKAIKDDMRIAQSTNNMLYSMKANKEIEIGGDFISYNVMGNTLMFAPSKAINIDSRYENKGYAICINVTPDPQTGSPAIANYTIEGGELISGTLIGMGGKDGRTSGDVSTMVTGSQYGLVGYSTAVLSNPYNTHIIEESVL